MLRVWALEGVAAGRWWEGDGQSHWPTKGEAGKADCYYVCMLRFLFLKRKVKNDGKKRGKYQRQRRGLREGAREQEVSAYAEGGDYHKWDWWR